MITVEPIATLRTCFPEKFGVPRQSGLVPAAWGVIEFAPACRRKEAVRGVEQFSHLWLITRFHLIESEPDTLTVRPPRLGGNERRGVFATRSPFRPNRMGLSVVKLERVETEGDSAPRLFVSGVDLVDGTPVLDIKPYVPYADCISGATSSMANDAPVSMPVHWDTPPPEDAAARAVIEQSIALNPQPAYQDDMKREYAAELAGWHVRWHAAPDGAHICDVAECCQ